jgi:hypothetical protein
VANEFEQPRKEHPAYLVGIAGSSRGNRSGYGSKGQEECACTEQAGG